ncbi:helix-turn-helix domain-containing protein [Chryseobacterium camelliae]|uniref:Helix-turn-helix domain-containing protein n=1 Tax=Chryseobacterium camelliae TaxID=1265445 RepID=A0ABY7QK53_9FLAO|nr:helix-turn-helix domain-containing protein [Chryseobacterium camelliae]WBV59519.1 helix-turn-helix domain-containing protein [Chryseobacterium camelliae]
MEPLSTPYIFYLAGIFIAFFCSLLIVGKRKKVTADYILALWFFIIGIHLALFLFIFSGEYERFTYVLGVEVPVPLIHGPMLYLYVLNLIRQNKSKYYGYLHFIPVMIIYFTLFDFFRLPSEDKISVYRNNGCGYKDLRKYVSILILVSGVVYTLLSFLLVREYKKKISEQFSNTEKINLNWTYYLIVSIALIWVAVFLKNDLIIFTLVVIFIVLAAYFGINKVGILNPADIQEIHKKEEKVNVEVVPAKYQKTSISEKSLQLIYQKLNERMESEKIFKDPELNLNQVAEMLNVHPNTLSQTINSIENKNFYDYINRKRIEEFKRIAVLPENQKFTILSLAFESGFNSKTSFNRNFRKYMNCSPREFLKSQNVNLE